MRTNVRNVSVIPILATILMMVGQAQTPQDNRDTGPVQQTVTSFPVATQWTLEAAGVVQQAEIKSVLLLYCPLTYIKGTGFLIDKGLVVTNNHVTAGCTAEQMIGFTSSGTKVQFSKMAADANVDLALLKPSQMLTGGLKLSNLDKPPVGTAVSTWGYPLQFNGPNPLLSNGYIAGFIEDGIGEKKVKHFVINGAFNPGNSGGPLFVAGSDKVVGIVVAKFMPYSPLVQKTIDVLSNNRNGLHYGNGTKGNILQTPSESQVVATVLQEFYNETQVMIGKAISVAELKSLLRSKEGELQ